MKKVLGLACLGTLLLASSVFGAAQTRSIPFYQIGAGENFFVAVTNVNTTASRDYTLKMFNNAGTLVYSTSPTLKSNEVDIWDSTTTDFQPNENSITTWPITGTGSITSTSGNGIVAWGVVYAVAPGATNNEQTGFTVTINGGQEF